MLFFFSTSFQPGSPPPGLDALLKVAASLAYPSSSSQVDPHLHPSIPKPISDPNEIAGVEDDVKLAQQTSSNSYSFPGNEDDLKLTQQTSSNTNSLPGAEKLDRTRERNRIHAQKTRQRKKVQIQLLRNTYERLKSEQQRLKQQINDRKTISALLNMSNNANETTNNSQTNNDISSIAEILNRDMSELPDLKQLVKNAHVTGTEKHAQSKSDTILDIDFISSEESNSQQQSQYPDDGIDYTILNKDRNKCSKAELEQIHRERNRMHAKRTRDRKKIFVQEINKTIDVLDAEVSE